MNNTLLIMKQKLIRLSLLVLFSFVGTSFFSCGTKSKPANGQKVKTEESAVAPVKKNKERKPFKEIVEAQIGDKELKMTDFDQELSADVVLLDNGIQLRLNDTEKRSILVNMYAPKLLKKIPISISRQMDALSPEEQATVDTKSKLSVVIPGNPPVQGDTKILLEGTVTLNELSDSKLVVTFSGEGFSGNRDNRFSMSGKIVLESFNVYEARIK
ncbi:MAG: hypothetical protein ACK5M7_18005 [Draconibacterium sp.]